MWTVLDDCNLASLIFSAKSCRDMTLASLIMFANLIDVMRDLMEEKNELVRENMYNITKANNDTLNQLSNQMKDKKLNAGGEIGGLLNSIKAMANIGSESTLEMNSQDRVHYAKLWFQNAEQIKNYYE
jgi:hypothetical protein